MSYLLKSSPRPAKKRPLIIVAIVVFALLLMFLLLPRLARGISSLLQTAGVPVWRFEAQLLNTATFFITPFSSKAALLKENKELRQKVEEQALLLLEGEATERENRELRTFLGRRGTDPSIIAGVLKRPAQLPYDTLLLDVGDRDGVVEGDRVMSNGVAIGEIISVLRNTSTALLYSSPGHELEVLIGSLSTSVIATGRGGGNFEARVPRGISVASGDPVDLPGLSGGQLGVVEAVFDRPTDSFVVILFKLPSNPRELRFVDVVLSSTHEEI